jgi:hypothetical protein
MSQLVVSKSVVALLSCNTPQNQFGYKPTSIFMTQRANTRRRLYKIQSVAKNLRLL